MEGKSKQGLVFCLEMSMHAHYHDSHMRIMLHLTSSWSVATVTLPEVPYLVVSFCRSACTFDPYVLHPTDEENGSE